MQLTMSRKRFVLILVLTSVLTMVVMWVALYYGSAYQKARQGLKSYDALVAYQNGSMELVDTNDDGDEMGGLQVYRGDGYSVYIQGDYVIQATDESTGCVRVFQNGILWAIKVPYPMREVVQLGTPFSTDFYFTLTVRSQDEIDRISAGIQEQGKQYLRDNDYEYMPLDDEYLVVL